MNATISTVTAVNASDRRRRRQFMAGCLVMTAAYASVRPAGRDYPVIPWITAPMPSRVPTPRPYRTLYATVTDALRVCWTGGQTVDGSVAFPFAGAGTASMQVGVTAPVIGMTP